MKTKSGVRGLVAQLSAVPVLVRVGVGAGVLAGLGIGLMVGAPVGIVVGLSLGASIGMVCGIVMDEDDQRANHRTRQLDAPIAFTAESAGAAPADPVTSERERQEALASWVSEWMTPQQPIVR